MDNPKIEIIVKDYGTMKAELYPEMAPATVENFIKLIKEKFFDGLIFHRVIPGFMIQGGGFDTNFMQKKAESINGEFSSNGFEQNTLKHSRGVLSMARTNDPNSASSQFFVMHRDAPYLDGQYAAFGILTSLLSTVASAFWDSSARLGVQTFAADEANIFSGNGSVIENLGLDSLLQDLFNTRSARRMVHNVVTDYRDRFIDEFDDVLDIKSHLQGKNPPERLCYPIYLASPGRPYYSYPNWYSIFRSGWYDHLASIPELKKAILKHNLGVKHIIYITTTYLDAKAKQAGIDPNDQKAVDELKQKLVEELNDKLASEENAGKALASLVKTIPTGNGVATEKYFTIEKVDNDVNGGEYLTDYETGANVVSYAMGVHPNLIGATPGKNSNSLSGSNIREIFLMKQALSKPMVDRAMRPFAAIKKINDWPTDYVLTLTEYTFTTLDEAKSGKKETQSTEA